MKTILFMAAALICLSAYSFADDEFRSDNDAYRAGYREGFKQGSMDQEAGIEFNARMADDVSDSKHFRKGYMEGYDDAYNKRSAKVTIYQDDDSDSTHVMIEQERDSALRGSRGFAVVFKDDGFDGRSQRFEVGKYDDLDGAWDENIGSIQLNGDVRVILFDDENFEGQSLIIETDSSDLDELNFKGRAESMIVESLP